MRGFHERLGFYEACRLAMLLVYLKSGIDESSMV